MTQDRPSLGIALTIAFCLLAPLGDTLVKLLGPYLTITQITTIRFAIQGAILIPLSLALGQGSAWRLDRTTLLLLVARTLMHISGIALVFAALLFLPLADAIAIAYVMPFIALLLGYLFLDETVGPRRLAACAVGFAGTMLVVQPAFAEVGLPALIPLAVALVFALYMLLSRALGPRLDPIAGQAIAAPIAVAVLIPLGLLQSAPLLPLAEIQENPSTGWLILAMGLVGTVAHLAMAWALKYAPASTLAPLQYLEIPVAVFYGWLVWRDLPDPLAAFGIAVIMAAGVYLILRERAAERVTRRASAVPVPAPRAVPPVPPSAE